jgi:glutathione S-transferase
MKLYAMPRSGNCYKVAWMLRLLNIQHDIVTTSMLDGSTKSPAFMSKNPNGQVPLLELDDGRFLAESNAILLYLSEKQTTLSNEPRLTSGCSLNNIPMNLPSLYDVPM